MNDGRDQPAQLRVAESDSCVGGRAGATWAVLVARQRREPVAAGEDIVVSSRTKETSQLTPDMFETFLHAKCTESCGWIAAIVSALCFGSFGVPVKGGPASKVNIDPLVMQSYKTAMCFLTCWLVIPMGQKFSFTPWGIVSGLFWVPGATAGIYGIRNAGLAIAVGTWSSLGVISSVCWGLFVFHEHVHSVFRACCAGLLLCSGLVGMSQYSSPRATPAKKGKTETDQDTVPLLLNESDEDSEKDETLTPTSTKARKRPTTLLERDSPPGSKVASAPVIPLEIYSHSPRGKTTESSSSKEGPSTFVFLNGRLTMTKRQLGILGAVINGTWGGTNMIPLHYASLEGYGGAGYTISFAIGASLVTLSMWLLRFLYHVYRTRGSFRKAYEALPSFHLREMWWSGFLSGSLYSLGNFCSILAVTYLGQGVGYSFTQMSMLVSGLWGIFFFKEIKGADLIVRWILAAAVTICGIIWLSYEHEGEAVH